MTNSETLSVEGLTTTYRGGAVGVADFNLRVAPGQIVALLGRNGAGKTSALRGISGFLRSEGATVTGSVSVNGRSVSGQPPYRTYAAGICHVPERDKVFPMLTVEEHWQLIVRDVNAVRAVQEEFPQLAHHVKLRASGLSGGQRQLLALSMAWLARPKVLLVDEASLGLAPVTTQAVAATIAALAQRLDTAVVIVDQETSPTIGYADQLVILQQGRVSWTGSPQEISPEELRSAIVGDVYA